MEFSRTRFEDLSFGVAIEAQVLGPGFDLESYKYSKLPCPWLDDNLVCWLVETENNQA